MALIDLVDLARKPDDTYLACADRLKAWHVESDFKDIREIRRAVYLSCAYSGRTLEFVAGYGKLRSVQLLADAVTIWTDVVGILSADRRLVREVVVLDDVSYQAATELAYFDTEVMYPSTMAPAIEKEIPIWSSSCKGQVLHRA